MAMSRRWWEPEVQDDLHDGERQGRHSFDLGDLMSLGMNGGEFAAAHVAALLIYSDHQRHTMALFGRRDAAEPIRR